MQAGVCVLLVNLSTKVLFKKGFQSWKIMEDLALLVVSATLKIEAGKWNGTEPTKGI